jgi:hypothetical protein
MKIEMIDIYKLAQRPEGITSGEVRSHFSLAQDNAKGRLEAMAKSGRLERKSTTGGRGTRWRYYADPAVSWEVAQQRFQNAQRKAKEARLDEARERMKGWVSDDAREAKKRPQEIVQRKVNGKIVNVQIGPCCYDTRYSAVDAPLIFRNLKIGEYMRSNSAISKSYSER